jgi:hypothetical protein
MVGDAARRLLAMRVQDSIPGMNAMAFTLGSARLDG